MAKAASKKSSKQIESLDLEELAAHLCGLQDKDDYDISDLDDGLMEKYDISFEQFEKLMRVLWPMVDLGVSPLTNSVFIGFTHKEGANGMWLAKRDFTSEFIGNAIQWASEGTPPAVGKTFVKTITVGGKPEFEFHIKNVQGTVSKKG